MITIHNSRWVLLAGLLAALVGVAAGPPPRSTGARAEPEDLSKWEWYHEIQLPPGTSGLVDFVLPPAVFGRSLPDLGDLRLIDSAGKTVSYALRIRVPRNVQEPLPHQRTFNRAVRPDRSVEISIDLGEAPPQHNEIAVQLAGEGYGRALRLDGSADGKTWSKLLDRVYVVHLKVEDKIIDQHRFSYSPSRFRYLRVQVKPDRVLENDEPQLKSVEVYHSVRVPGEEVTHTAVLQPREPVRSDNEYASAWVIDLGAARVPCERLDVQIEEREFTRHFKLEQFEPGQPEAQLLVTGELRREVGNRSVSVPIVLQRPVFTRWLRLTIEDARNPPLTIGNVWYTASAREVVFRVPEGTRPPLRLYYGNPKATAPRYDFASTLPPRLGPLPDRVELGVLERNPQYVAPPLPWTERWPYLVDAVLTAACAVLLVILVVLARTALRRQDESLKASA
jgi:hypothetical protein